LLRCAFQPRKCLLGTAARRPNVIQDTCIYVGTSTFLR
jgi:hypothetical protein